MKSSQIILAFIALLFPLSMLAQEARLSIEKDSIPIGGQTLLEISLRYRIDVPHEQIVWPTLKEALGPHVEILETGKLDTLPDQEDPMIFEQRQSLLISSFDTGYHVIAPLAFKIDSLHFESNAALLGVFAPKANLDDPFKDIKDIHEVEISFWQRYKKWWYVPALLLLAAALFFLWRKYLRNRVRQGAVEVTPEIKIDPKEHALARLEALKKDQLWQRGLVKEHHSLVSEIFREYLERQFNTRALEETSSQIIKDLRYMPLAPEMAMMGTRLLKETDLVKFAKVKPDPATNEQVLIWCVQFINETYRKAHES